MRRKQPSSKCEATVYQDDPDAIAIVFDPDRNEVIPVEIGFYYHCKTGSTIYLLNDARSKQLLSEAQCIDLVRFSKSLPSKTTTKPKAKQRPVTAPSRS